MCLILLAHQSHPRFPLVLAANRDEFFARPTLPADYWTDAAHVLGGRDLEKGGTWMGVTRDGRWAAVTNYRDGTRPAPGAASRGQLVGSFLTGRIAARAHAGTVAASASAYPGFNLLVGDAEGVYYVSHQSLRPRRLPPGIYGLSNHLLDSAWPKVISGKRELERILAEGTQALDDGLLRLLADRQTAEDSLLPQTGVDARWEKRLSAPFIVAPGYGTRASSILLVDSEGEVLLRERSFDEGGDMREDRSFRFTLEAATAPL